MSPLLCSLLLNQIASSETTVQTIVVLPELSAVERSTLHLIAESATRQTEDYLRRDMLAMTDGRPVKMTVQPDHVRVSVTVSGSDGTPAVSITESLIRRAILRTEDLQKHAARLAARRVDPWTAAFQPPLPPPYTNQDRVLHLYRKVFKPESTSIFVGGAAEASKVRTEWERRITSWTSPRDRDRPRWEPEPKMEPAKTETFDLGGKLFPARDPSLPTQLLALVMLGSGKGSSLHRVLREQKGWSYRQESVLRPTFSGWQSHLLVATSRDVGKREMREALVKDIDSWAESHRSRGLGMARGFLLHGVPMSPLYLSAEGPLGAGLEDRTYIQGYWKWKTGSEWNPARMLDLMALVPLDELKEAAKSLVSGADQAG